MLLPLQVAFVRPAAGQAQWGDTHCYYPDAPGRSRSFSLPAGYTLHLVRSSDPDIPDGSECLASVRNATGTEVWKATGFGAGVEPWTGHDVDNDGLPDAVVTVDTGGGNGCCWLVHVLRLTKRSIRVDTLDVATHFEAEGDGRTVLWDIIPFYALGPDMADAPVVHLARRYQDGRLVDITATKCPAMLDDTAHGLGSLRSEWAAATPELRAAARTGADTAWTVQRTRVAVSTLALQQLACGEPQAGRGLVDSAWPRSEAATRWQELTAAWAKAAAHYGGARSDEITVLDRNRRRYLHHVPVARSPGDI